MYKNISKIDRSKAAGPKRRGRLLLYGFLAAVVLAAAGHYMFSEELETTFCHLYSPKVAAGENIRVVVLSDLHNREFGPDNADLLERIAALNPDLIAVAGDMVNADEENLDVVLTLCSGLVEIATVYYSPGNHESNLMYEKGSPIESLLLERGVHVLVNRAEEADIHRTPLLIGGLTTSTEDYEEYGAEFFEEYENSSAFKLLIAHYPSLYYEYLQMEILIWASADTIMADSSGSQWWAGFITGIQVFFRSTTRECTNSLMVQSLYRGVWGDIMDCPASIIALNWRSLISTAVKKHNKKEWQQYDSGKHDCSGTDFVPCRLICRADPAFLLNKIQNPILGSARYAGPYGRETAETGGDGGVDFGS